MPNFLSLHICVFDNVNDYVTTGMLKIEFENLFTNTIALNIFRRSVHFKKDTYIRLFISIAYYFKLKSVCYILIM